MTNTSILKGHLDIGWVTDQNLSDLNFLHRVDDYDRNALWPELGIDPPNYPAESIVLYQLFDDECPEWAQRIKEYFDPWILYSGMAITMLQPGHINNPHKDSLYRLKNKVEQNNIDVSELVPVRINMFLQDRKVGHFLDFDQKVIDSYQRGDFIVIFPNRIHSVANAGYENRYTLQISGFVKEEELYRRLTK